MLNKIKVIGMFLKTEQPENKIENVNSVSQETENETDKTSSKLEAERGSSREPWFRFSLMAWTPSGSKTVLRCIAEREVAERVKKEVGDKEVIEVRGYLRNESSGLQIIIKVVEFSKIDPNFEEVDKSNSNQVRMLGKIINDLHFIKDKWNREVLSFKLVVPREGVKLPLFFCRVNDRANEKGLIPKFKEKLKKGDIILLEGFLQTQKVEEAAEGGETKIKRVSSINCYGFTFLDNDSVNIFTPLDNLTRVFKKVEEIEFEPENKA
jgi:hypothetical protein